MREHTASEGEVIIRKNDVDDKMYIIVSGSARVHDGEITIRTVSDGDIVGELAVLDPAPRAATVTALTQTHLFTPDRGTLYDLMASRPEVLHGIMRVLVKRVRTQIDIMENVKG